jgi:hypothetical protein
MYINEYGNKNDPLILLLAQMMVSGEQLYQLMQPYFKENDHFIAPDQGGHKRTDWFIRHLYQPKGFFTPPYETEESLRTRLSGLYEQAEVSRVEGIGYFCCLK